MAIPATRTNLATNPSSETASGTVTVRTNLTRNPAATAVTDYTGTAGGGTPTLSAVATGGPAGGPATFVRGTTATAGWTYIDLRNAGTATNLVTVGKTYTASAAMRSSIAGTVTAYIMWLDGAGATLSTTTSTGLPNNTVNTWARVSVTGTAPASAVRALIVFRVTAATAVNSTLDLTAVLFEASPVSDAYFDGGNAAAGDFTYAWTGTANLSTSTQTAPGVAGWTSAGGGIAYRSATSPYTGTYCTAIVAGGVIGNGAYMSGAGATAAPGNVFTLSAYILGPAGQKARIDFDTRTGGGWYVTSNTSNISLTGAWQRVSITGTVPAGADAVTLGVKADSAFSGLIYVDAILYEKASALDTYFDGDTPLGGGWQYNWSGTPHASNSTRDYYGVWAEQIAGPGAPKVQVTALTGNTSVTSKVTRQADSETWTLPGWKARNTLSGETLVDAAPPLGVPVTYTLYANGVAISAMQITLSATTGWIQDPLDPSNALPVNLTNDDVATLSLAKPALKQLTYSARFEEEYPLGGRYPIARASQRGAAQGVELHLNAQRNTASDALLALIAAAPILQVRPLPSWGSLPALCYLVGDADEMPLNRDVGGQFTVWKVAGKLVAPVTLAPLTGKITNQQVADNLQGRTHASILAASGAKRNIDIQANPLGLGQ